ncbi:MAG: N-acetylmuramoyl-L-alanine amidase [Xanthomonadaceae bacterium]|nr:N-acetylmuramoyl-L-alanine amidase [Xanthomonadaceae bacterium]
MFPDLPPNPPVLIDPLPYESRLDARPLSQIDLVVIHCTEVPTLELSRTFGERILYEGSGTGNSGHYYIDRDGRVVLYVQPGRIANHVRGYNEHSVGIELVNTGRYPHWRDSKHQAMDEPYPEPQIEALIGLLRQLQAQLPLRHIAGHEDLDTALETAIDDPAIQVPRKRDPGPMFPWSRVLEATGLPRLVP